MSQHIETCRAVHVAAASGRFQQLVHLLEQSPELVDAYATNTDCQGKQSRTPSLSAATGYHITCLELLGSYNANAAAVTRNGRTALHLAVEAAPLSAVTWLLEYRIELTATGNGCHEVKFIDITDTSGSTALHIAASMGQSDIANILLVMGAKLDPTDNSGRMPLHCAVMNSQDIMAASLIARGSAIKLPEETKTPT